MQSGALKQTSLMVKYLKTLSMQKFMASGAKRVAVAGTEYVLVRMLVPGALASSVTYLATSTAGTVGKNMASYGYRIGTGQQAEVMIAIPKEEVEQVQKIIRGNKKWSWNISELPSQMASAAKAKAVGTCTTIINLSYEDLSEGTGALIGSTAATAGMLYFLGPPTLVALPLYLLLEGGCKSIGAFFGKHFGRLYIGPSVIKPAIKSAWAAYWGEDPAKMQAAIDKVYDVKEVDIGESPCSDVQLQQLMMAWTLLEEAKPELADYCGESAQPATNIEDEPPKAVFFSKEQSLSTYVLSREYITPKGEIFQRPEILEEEASIYGPPATESPVALCKQVSEDSASKITPTQF